MRSSDEGRGLQQLQLSGIGEGYRTLGEPQVLVVSWLELRALGRTLWPFKGVRKLGVMPLIHSYHLSSGKSIPPTAKGMQALTCVRGGHKDATTLRRGLGVHFLSKTNPPAIFGTFRIPVVSALSPSLPLSDPSREREEHLCPSLILYHGLPIYVKPFVQILMRIVPSCLIWRQMIPWFRPERVSFGFSLLPIVFPVLGQRLD